MNDQVDSNPDSVKFHFIKSSHFRVIHVDGAIGGLTPRGLIHAALYSERGAIPQVIEQDFSPDGDLLAQRTVAGKDGVTRELDVDLMLNYQSAVELRDLLAKLIKRFDEVSSEDELPEGESGE